MGLRFIHSPRRRQLAADVLLLLVTLIWGSTFVMVKAAVSSYPVFHFIALRFGFAFVLLLLLGARRLRTLRWRTVGAGVLIGVMLFAGYGFQTLGLRYTSASKAGLITGLSVVLVPLMSTLIMRSRPNPAAVVGVALATFGLGLLSLSGSLRVSVGDLLVLACAFSFALHIVFVGFFSPSSDPLLLTIIQLATVSGVSAVVGLFSGKPWPAPTGAIWFAAGFTGVFATAAAFTIQTAVQRFTTSTHTALIFTGEPVFAAIFGALLAGDVLTVAGMVGGVLIIAGMLVSEIDWSFRAAQHISRFLSPHYVAGTLLLFLGLADPISWSRGLLWSVGVGVPTLAAPLMVFRRQLRKGKISDWHITNREERLQPLLIGVSIVAAGVPLAALLLFRGPRLLVVAFATAMTLVVFNLLITTRWKISQHVSAVSACATLVAATQGMATWPVLLLVPLVAWARVKVHAHTVMQTIAGGLAGALVPIAALYLLRR